MPASIADLTGPGPRPENGERESGVMPIAVIGMSCRFPQEAENPEKLWEMLVNARSASTEFPAHKLNIDAHYHPDPTRAGSTSVRRAHFMKDSGHTFDAPFFNISKTEAMTMDPQQRLLMENVYEALENAGIQVEDATGTNTSVFVGAFTNDYHQVIHIDPEIPAKYAPTGNSNSILSNRVSWFYDFQGCSLTLDTACSSSLVATHLACQNLREGSSEMSIVGGVNVIEYPVAFYDMTTLGFLSPDGRCYSFDHRANGYSRGEGTGAIILKPLDAAIRDGNTIRAVIRNTGVNQDGRTPGMTIPSKAAQEKLIRSVYKQAGMDLAATTYVETHGTGTAQGDPKEAGAIAAAWAERTAMGKEPLYLGAIKSNIGHLEGASGVAGIIKTVHVLEKAIIPPNINFEKPNPSIPAEEWGIQFPVKPTPFPNVEVRRASINSFGFGGTNAHVVLDDAYNYLRLNNLQAIHRTVIEPPKTIELPAPEPEVVEVVEEEKEATNGTNGTEAHVNGDAPTHGANGTEAHSNGVNGTNGHANEVNGDATTATNGTNGAAEEKKDEKKEVTIGRPDGKIPQIFVLSSFDENGIKRGSERLSKYLSSTSVDNEGTYLNDMAYTLATKRSVFSWKAFAVAASVAELAENFSKAASTLTHSRKVPAKAGFVFTGQGAQWHAMGRDLLVYPVFKEAMDSANAYLKHLGCSWDLIEELSKSAEESKMNTPAVSQAACTALQVALVDLLTAFDIRPTRVIGHSSGEIAAAYCAGALSREAAWKVAYYRGIVSEKVGGMNGAMMAVGTSQEVLQPYLDTVNNEIKGELTMACFNSPKNITVSGDEAKIDRLGELLKKDDIFQRKLNVRNAYHSGHMQAVAEEYETLMGKLDGPSAANGVATANVTMYSTVVGKEIPLADLCTPKYWVNNMVSPVSFTATLLNMCSTPAAEKGKLRVNRGTEAPVRFMIEVGPHPALQSAIKDTFAGDKNLATIPYTYLVQRNKSAVDQTLQAIGKLFCSGFPVDIARINAFSEPMRNKSTPAPKMLIDLPPYSFNHAQDYWPEGRWCKNFRFKKHARKDLLGGPVIDWNSTEPKWRQFLRLTENPWMKDHKVTGRVVYPGVGYIVMALEAAKQLAEDRGEEVTGFVLRDIYIKAALTVPEAEEGIEVLLALSPAPESSVTDSSLWKSFKISSFNPNTDSWTEHCRGQIKTEHDTKIAIDEGREAAAEAEANAIRVKDCLTRCDQPFDMGRAYSELETIGLSFGPLFKNLNSVSHSTETTEAVGTIKIPDVAEAMPKKFLFPHTIHPTTLDSMLHVFLAAVQGSDGKNKVVEPMVPVSIKEVRIARDINSEAGKELQSHAIAVKTAHKRFEATIHCWDPETKATKVQFRGLQFVPLQSASSGVVKRQINFNVQWKPVLDLMSNEQCRKFVDSVYKPLSTDEVALFDIIKSYNLASIIYVRDALAELKDLDEESLPIHLKKYLVWMKFQNEQFEKSNIMHQTPEWNEITSNQELKEKLLKKAEDSGAEGQMAARIGSNIAKIMRNEVDALQLMFGDSLMDTYYRSIHGTENVHEYLRVYLDTYGLQTSNIKVLEIGAGTGGTTWPVLETLCPTTGYPRVAKYTYSDISPGFFEKAKAKFKAYSHVLEFMKLDIEKDPLEQGYEAGTYDVIIAANVLHATKDLTNTFTNVRTLLKPGGKLILQEAIQPRMLCGPLVFGTLPGWWLSKEDFRALYPLMTEERWDEVLKAAGFSGTDQILGDYSNPDIHAQSLMITTNPKAQAATEVPEMKTIVLAPSSMQSLASEVTATLQRQGATVQTLYNWSDIEKVEDLKQTVCVILHELEAPVFSDINEADFLNIRNLFTNCGGLVWVSKDHMDDLETSCSTGLIRTVRWERDLDESNLILVQMSASDIANKSVAAQVGRIYAHQFVLEHGLHNSEYKVVDGVIETNRLVNANYLDEYVLSKSGKVPAASKPFGSEPDRALKLVADSPGLLNSLQFVDCPVYPTPLEEHDVEVEIRATGLNFRDIMASMGEVKGDTLGAEGSGVVTRVGSAVTNTKPGDRVALLASLTGTFQTYARTLDIAVAKIPDEISFEEAACIPVVGSTVLYCLKDLARLRKGESILIHAAAGGVGQAAIMYAQHVGAEIYATVSNDEKKKVITETYGIPEDHIFSSRDVSFAKGVMRQTGGRGVDVVLNSLAGELLRLSWQCVAHFGRFVEIGKRDIYSNGALEMFPFSRNITFASADLETVIARDKETIARLLTETIDLWHQGVFKPLTPLTISSFSKIEECFRQVQAGKHIGKLVLTAGKEDLVPIVPASPPEYRFKSNATYILSGGLGGLGRSTAQWMVSQGARNLVFFSRSGASNESICEFIRDLESKGATAKALACDVGNAEVLKKTIATIQETMPPIKGCIQGAMQLRDAAFEKMTHEEFTAAIKPKVNGSWNLHEQLPKDMDFYLMLSSICGIIGNRGQGNYAAGNTFQDALAHYRNKQGLPCSTIDLGSMLSVGFIHENQDTVNQFAFAVEAIREDEFHAVMEHYIDPRNSQDQLGDQCQVAIGLSSKAHFIAKGFPEPPFLKVPLFTLLQTSTGTSGGDGEEEDLVALRASLRASKSIVEASSVILDTLARKLSSVMALPLEDIDPSKPVHYYGVDSLVAVELRNWLTKNMESQIEILDIMGDESMSKLCDKIAKNSKLVNVEDKA